MPITRGQSESNSEESQATGGENQSETPIDVTVVQKQLETSFKVALHLDSQTETILKSRNERKLQRHKGNSLEAVEGLLQKMDDDKEASLRHDIEAREEEKRMRIRQEEEEKQERLRRYDLQWEENDCNVGKRNNTLQGYLSWR